MIPINIWPTICFLIRIFLSLAIYKSIESLRPRCPLQTAPVRTEGLFWRPHGCNIAEGNDPPSEAVAEVWHRFFENFSAADFSPHLRRASCTFVCRKNFRHTKGARSARPGAAPESQHLKPIFMDEIQKEKKNSYKYSFRLNEEQNIRFNELLCKAGSEHN